VPGHPGSTKEGDGQPSSADEADARIEVEEAAQGEEERRERGHELAPAEDIAPPPVAEAEKDPSAPTASPTVVTTTTGKRFHRRGCRLAGEAARTVERRNAVAARLVPCLTCRP
jgi:hypothetical protein